MSDAIHIEGVSKRFTLPGIRREATLKDFALRALRSEGGNRVVDALKDITFSVQPGSMLGIIGRNGSGKTTLMRILAGILMPDRGTVKIEGTLAPLLALGTGFHPDLTGREGARIELLSLGFSRSQVNGFMDQIISFSEIGEFVDAPVRTYSIGMVMRLAFSVAICVDPDVLLLDEVLAVGDEKFALKCLDCIADFRRRGKTIVLVTHNAEVVETWCDTALWLDQGQINALGDPHTVVTAYHDLGQTPASKEGGAQP